MSALTYLYQRYDDECRAEIPDATPYQFSQWMIQKHPTELARAVAAQLEIAMLDERRAREARRARQSETDAWLAERLATKSRNRKIPEWEEAV